MRRAGLEYRTGLVTLLLEQYKLTAIGRDGSSLI